MRIFKNNANIGIDEIKAKYKKLPDNFSQTYNYLKRLVLENKNFDPNQKIDGKLWLRELFMQAQSNMPQLNMPLFTLLNMLITCTYLISIIVIDRVGDDLERTENRSVLFWYYHGITTLNTTALVVMDFGFLWFAFWDAFRRIYLMK